MTLTSSNSSKSTGSLGRGSHVGREADFADPGTYALVDVAGESVVVVRGRDRVCAPSTTSAGIAARRSSTRPTAETPATSSAFSARTTPGSTTSTARSAARRTPTS